MSTEDTPALYRWLREDPRRFDVAVTIAVVAFTVMLFAGNPEETDVGWPEVVAGIGAILLLLFRRIHPPVLLALSLLATVGFIVILDRPAPTLFPTFVLLGTTAVRTDRRTAVILGGVVGLSLYAAALRSTEFQFADARALIVVVWSMGVVGIADATRSWRSYRQSSEAEIRSAVLASEAQARQQVSEERLNIARELHDLLAHNLSVMNVQTGAALHLLRSDPDQAETALVAARDAGKGVLEELRDLLTVLRHEGDDEEPMSSLPKVDQLADLVDTMRGTGLSIAWTESGTTLDLPPAVSLAAYRIVQEGLTNAAKHGTGHADLETRWVDGGLVIRIDNALSGEAGVGSGLGLIGMQERASANGGRLTATPEDGSFVVDAWLPALSATPRGENG